MVTPVQPVCPWVVTRQVNSSCICTRPVQVLQANAPGHCPRQKGNALSGVGPYRQRREGGREGGPGRGRRPRGGAPLPALSPGEPRLRPGPWGSGAPLATAECRKPTLPDRVEPRSGSQVESAWAWEKPPAPGLRVEPQSARGQTPALRPGCTYPPWGEAPAGGLWTKLPSAGGLGQNPGSEAQVPCPCLDAPAGNGTGTPLSVRGSGENPGSEACSPRPWDGGPGWGLPWNELPVRPGVWQNPGSEAQGAAPTRPWTEAPRAGPGI